MKNLRAYKFIVDYHEGNPLAKTAKHYLEGIESGNPLIKEFCYQGLEGVVKKLVNTPI